MKEGDEILDINQYIEERLNNQIQWYSQKSQHAQKMYKIFQVTEIIIAAAILTFPPKITFSGLSSLRMRSKCFWFMIFP